jgi:hypothetical protein
MEVWTFQREAAIPRITKMHQLLVIVAHKIWA